jgi:hypothetical protein
MVGVLADLTEYKVAVQSVAPGLRAPSDQNLKLHAALGLRSGAARQAPPIASSTCPSLERNSFLRASSGLWRSCGARERDSVYRTRVNFRSPAR